MYSEGTLSNRRKAEKEVLRIQVVTDYIENVCSAHALSVSPLFLVEKECSLHERASSQECLTVDL